MAWYDSAVFYHIYPLGLCGCPHDNSGEEGNHFDKLNEREVPLTREAIRILNEQKKKKVIRIENSMFVFTGNDGEIVSGQNYSRTLSYICKKNGIEPISMHSLRHTFATRCIEAGMKPKTLQTILGHSTLDMTMNKYVHTTDDEKFKELELVEHTLSSAL